MTRSFDQPRAVRAGEELPADRLAAWLGVPEVAALQFPGGHSNLTYLVRAGDRQLVLRRPPFGSKVKTAHDMGREFRVLSALHPVWPLVPKPVAFCEDESVLGARFYVMERLEGVILRNRPPPIDPDTARRLSELFVDALCELHALDWRAAGLGDFGKPDGYVERQVGGWSKRYVDARTDDIPEMERAAAWLAAHLPPSPAPTIVHNDFKYDNIVMAPELDRVVGVLDWEMATIGDPLMDLGTALCYWTEAGDADDLRKYSFGPTTLPGFFTREELAARYAARSGRDLAHLTFYYVFGLFKTAVVAQQIYFRWKAGLTKDERFATMLDGTRALARQAERGIQVASVKPVPST